MDFLAVGNNELEGLPKLGKTAKCWTCGKRHRIKFGKDAKTGKIVKDLAYFNLCGINRVEWMPKKEQKRIYKEYRKGGN